MANKGIYIKSDYNINHPKKMDVSNLSSEKFSDTNFYSNFGTIFTVSSSSAAGITESVITPGIRMFKLAFTTISILKNLETNINIIKKKSLKICKITNSLITEHDFKHIRETVLKLATNN